MEENVLFSVETVIQKAHPAVAVFPVQDAEADVTAVAFPVGPVIQKAHPAVAVFPVQDAGAGSPDSFGISGACETPAE